MRSPCPNVLPLDSAPYHLNHKIAKRRRHLHPLLMVRGVHRRGSERYQGRKTAGLITSFGPKQANGDTVELQVDMIVYSGRGELASAWPLIAYMTGAIFEN